MNHFPAQENSLVIGVDIGGTKVAAGLVDDKGEIHNSVKMPMVVSGTAEDGLAAVKGAIDSVLQSYKGKCSIRAIGVCAPGPLDARTGFIINPPNLPCWRDYHLTRAISDHYGIPTHVDNDANGAAIAEAEWGAGRGYKNIFYTTIGTGIGTGIIIDARLLYGRTGIAGEGGHVSIDRHGPICSCGKPGCIEIFASGPAIARRAREKLAAGNSKSKILELAGGDLNAVRSETVGRAYNAGDAVAAELLDETVDYLSLWLSNMIDLLDPDVAIFGGSVSAMFYPFLDEMLQRAAKVCVNTRAHELLVLPARYGEEAGIAGAASLCFGTLTSLEQAPLARV